MSRILSALADRGIHSPDSIAITGSDVELSWRELAAYVDTLAGHIAEVRVLGLLMDNSPGWIVADLAALAAGCTHIPLPGFFNDEQLRHAIYDAGVDTLIADSATRVARLFPDRRTQVLNIAGQSCVRIDLEAAINNDLAGTSKVTYTSGTTGVPRGVCLSLHTLEAVAQSLAAAAQASSTDRSLVLLPLPILLENIGSVYAAILAGAHIVVPSPTEAGICGSSKVDPAKLARVLLRYRPTALIVPPAVLKLLVQIATSMTIPDSLRMIAVGGAPVGSALLRAAEQAGLPVFQGYGLSEAGSVISVNTPAEHRSGSTGKPLPHCQVRISERGEICVRGIAFNGYLNGTVHDAGSELHTGDLGYLDDDGFLYVTGRLRDRIITAFGRNVNPEWIESELQAHAFILQAAVFGDRLPALVAILVPAAGVTLEQLQLAVTTVNGQLPDYARIASWLCADTPFNQSNGELAAGGALRRSVVEQHYAGRLDLHSGWSHG